ncbi:nitrite reductase small subunit NirD [Sulfitobacter geojensis]|uniref:nitrite reductase small subunit NirD n=1 Tax=Sulfitobacter geojensis TaxID=1342299 RepID=UPI0004688462|nr:nitrite reductase small subunit NirD [Sulfitobacter geojensis]KHA52459.1 Nitrite reductase [NAD(P)H] small subunit [Sulfitobacter geojensis]NYI29847.1 nitrite reductase (NADH) small subunit [Sulfitobacter geojensis]
MSDWIDIASLDDVPQRGARVVKTTQGCVAVFRTANDEVYALDNSCPHKGGPLAEGIVHGASVTCPLHNWVFSLETGLAAGADEGQVATYRARVLDGRIELEAAFLAARSAA